MNLWTMRNDLCFQEVVWKEIWILLGKVSTMPHQWKILCGYAVGFTKGVLAASIWTKRRASKDRLEMKGQTKSLNKACI